MLDSLKNKQTILIISAGAFLLYLPFMSRQFMGDDWLWLYNAKMAMNNPEIFLERPMYGYFRPFNMLLIFSLLKLFGVKAYLFSLTNILLHSVNVWMLWKVLEKFEINVKIRISSVLIFGFYFLNASAIEWISVGHDLWVTFLTLLFTLKTINFIKKPCPGDFIQILMLGIAATLFKESGFVTIGIYFLLLILNGKNPISRNIRYYSLLMIISYLIYLIIYFKTRTMVDKEIGLGFGTIINLWYLLSYTLTPFSKRVLSFVPEQMLWIIKLLKITVAIMLPLIAIYLVKKGSKAAIYFFIWSVMFLSTVSVFNWNLSLFDLYPERTVSRFMYSAILGMAVVLSWFLYGILFQRFQFFSKRVVFIPLIMIFILGNFLIIKKVSGAFVSSQKLSNNIIEGLDELSHDFADGDTLLVITDDIDHTAQIIKSEIHLKAIVFVEFDKHIEVLVQAGNFSTLSDQNTTSKTHVIGWDTSINKFVDTF